MYELDICKFKHWILSTTFKLPATTPSISSNLTFVLDVMPLTSISKSQLCIKRFPFWKRQLQIH